MHFDHNFKKWFGQNFLRDVKYIIDFLFVAEIKKDNLVLEIGPGNGVLTEYLVEEAGEVIVVEIDDELIPVLQEKFANYDNFKLVHGDILKINLDKVVKDKDYKVVGALPYNISKKIIQLFLESENPPTDMTFIIQKEVAYKYSDAAPKASFLSMYAQLYSDVEFIAPIPLSAFEPQPKVDGAIIQFRDIQARFSKEDTLAIRKFIKLGYSAPRKKLSKNLANYDYDKDKVEQVLEAKLNLTKTARASELELADWIELYNSLN